MRLAHQSIVTTGRRSFLGALGALILPALALAATPADRAGAMASDDDEAWLRELRGKHRTAFDVEQHRNGHALGQAASLLDAWEREYRLVPPRVNVVLGVRGGGLPLVLDDERWARYAIGEGYQLRDARGGAPFTRNPFIERHAAEAGLVAPAQSVDALMRRGVTVLVCNNTIRGAARRFAGTARPPAEVEADLVAGLVHGVVLVPAMLMAFTRMQERGIAYVYVG